MSGRITVIAFTILQTDYRNVRQEQILLLRDVGTILTMSAKIAVTAATNAPSLERYVDKAAVPSEPIRCQNLEQIHLLVSIRGLAVQHRCGRHDFIQSLTLLSSMNC